MKTSDMPEPFWVTPEEYLDFLRQTKWYAHANQKDSGELAYMSLGLAGEAGEFVDLVKKVVRDHGYDKPLEELSIDLQARLADELGDALWYLIQLADVFGLSIQELMAINMYKLKKREADGGKGRQHVE